MSVGQIAGSNDRIIVALRDASRRTGVDFDFLLNQAKVESGLNADAAAASSSARGLFQFTISTWRATVARHGAEHGLTSSVDARDPMASALMAGSLAVDNAAVLDQALGRRAGPTELYLAHFLGAAGAVRFLQARDATPGAAAAAIMPTAARSNRVVFFDGEAPRSLAEVYDRFAARLGGRTVPVAAADLPVAPQAQAARFAYLLLAELGA